MEIARGVLADAASIDWCANPRLPRLELRELMVAALLEIMRIVAPAGLVPG
jgi:hypothetical protein